MQQLNEINAAMAGWWQKRAEFLQNETEHWKARAENGNHQIILLCKTLGLGCATLKNGCSVAVRKNADYPGERTPVTINAGECFVYTSTSTVINGDTPITLFKLADGSGFVHNFCPDTPKTKTIEIIFYGKSQVDQHQV